MSKNYKPTSSPQNAKADFAGIVAHLSQLVKVNEISNHEAELIATAMFEILSVVEDDQAVISGKVDAEIFNKIDFPEKEYFDFHRIKVYVGILNDLFKLANNSEIGALRSLNKEFVDDYDIRTAAKARCAGGTNLLETLCEIANAELEARRPNISPSVKGAFSLGVDSQKTSNQKESQF